MKGDLKEEKMINYLKMTFLCFQLACVCRCSPYVFFTSYFSVVEEITLVRFSGGLYVEILHVHYILPVKKH